MSHGSYCCATQLSSCRRSRLVLGGRPERALTQPCVAASERARRALQNPTGPTQHTSRYAHGGRSRPDAGRPSCLSIQRTRCSNRRGGGAARRSVAWREGSGPARALFLQRAATCSNSTKICCRRLGRADKESRFGCRQCSPRDRRLRRGDPALSEKCRRPERKASMSAHAVAPDR
jgi:hypothetical protein